MIPILMTTYNRLPYSILSYQAIKKYTKHQYKLFIFDQGSTDGTKVWLKYLKEIDPDVQIFESGVNVGISKAMNFFIKKYKDFPVLAKVDNDCLIDKEWIEKLYESLLRYKLDIVGSCVLRPYGDTWESWTKLMTYEKPLFFNDYVGGSGILFKTELFKQRGLLYENFGLLGTWTYFQRKLACEGGRIAFDERVKVRQLDLAKEHVKSEDFPEYDKEIKNLRDQGNDLWCKIGGVEGLTKYIEDNGGIEKLD